MAYEARENRNPNNCVACEHRKQPNGGWCRVFVRSPNIVCTQHTARYARLKGCLRTLGNGQRCDLDAPCPDCGPTLHG